MYSTIKHIILPMISGMACAVISCTSEPEPAAISPEAREEISFELAGSSRAVATTNENIIDQPFMLFGDVNSSGNYFAGVKTIFDWESVKYNSLTKSWEYEKAQQYWLMGQEHSFVAIHPYISRGDSQVSILNYEDNKLSFTYCLPEKLEEAKDLLFATHRRRYSLDNSGPVKFEFTHLLARINVSLALICKDLMYDHVDEKDLINNPLGNKNEYIKVHSIEFHTIKTKASFSFSPLGLTSGKTSTYDYEKTYLIRDDDRIETIRVTLQNACKVPNSYKQPSQEEENYTIEYVKALNDNEIIVMLPQSFGPDSESIMVVNYSINEDKDLERRIIIPLKNTTWKEGTIYTYKLLIDNPYYNHIVEDGEMSVDIEDFRLSGQTGDDSWITDFDDEDHNISYGYDEEGNCGPI